MTRPRGGAVTRRADTGEESESERRAMWLRIMIAMENRPMRRIVLALLIGSLSVSPCKLWAAPPAASSEVSTTAQEELVRRQAAQVAGRALLDEGQKLYYEGKYAEAIAKLEQALKTIPRAKATEVDYSRALHPLTDSYLRL